jgi:alpha-glucosidase (family GH31 glycosyl hydrolase)
MNDPALVKIAQTQTQAHHDLIPYTRSYAYKATQTGMPIMRAMILAYPNDTSVYDTWNQYMYGGEILVAPVTAAGTTSRSVYLPAGKWINYNDKATTSAGGTSVTATAPLATIPLFVKEGAIIPRGDILQSNNNWTAGWAANLRIEVFPAASGSSSFDYYTGSAVQTITSSLASGTLTIKFGDLGTDGKLEVYCSGSSGVVRNGVTLTSGTDFTYDAAKKLLTVSYSGATTLEIAGTASIF